MDDLTVLDKFDTKSIPFSLIACMEVLIDATKMKIVNKRTSIICTYTYMYV